MNRQSRVSHLERFYDLLWSAEQRFGLHHFNDTSTWRANPDFPRSGVYFVFEKDELRDGRSDWHRVVRVGTHWVSAVRSGSTADLARRLGNHYGSVKGDRGANSIFRVHIGSALAGGRPEWWLGPDRQELPIEAVGELQQQISNHMREKMMFVVIPVDDPPSKHSLRRKIELGAVSLLSNFNSDEGDAIDASSSSWLGRRCVTKRVSGLIARSGLWNVDGVIAGPTSEFLSDMRAILNR